jgi:hypothetical protein
LFVYRPGHHAAVWRFKHSAPEQILGIAYYQDLARRAEAVKFDGVFFADGPSLTDPLRYASRFRFKPLIELSAIAAATTNALIAAVTTTNCKQYLLARLFASLDHISRGRAGWKIVTAAAPRRRAEFRPSRAPGLRRVPRARAAKGRFVVGDDSFDVEGHGLRDKSWGPRHWQAINWYRWRLMNFGPDFAMLISLVADDNGKMRQGGMVLQDATYDLIGPVTMDGDWDANGYQTALRSHVATQTSATYGVEGQVLSLISLRNRRKTPDCNELTTRITLGMTEYRCNGQVGYGLSEYLDQIVDGRPTGADLPASWTPPTQ